MKRPLCLGCLLFLVLLRLGLCLLGAPENPYEELGESVVLRGRVAAKEQKGERWLFYLEDVRTETEYLAIGLICVPEEGALPPMGAEVTVRGRLWCYSKATNPGEFDLRLYYLYRGYGGRLSVEGWEYAEPGYDRWREGLWQLRCACAAIYERILPAEDAGVLRAMVLGDRGELSAELKELYRINGIVHILAISGVKILSLSYSLFGKALFYGTSWGLIQSKYIAESPDTSECDSDCHGWGITIWHKS